MNNLTRRQAISTALTGLAAAPLASIAVPEQLAPKKTHAEIDAELQEISDRFEQVWTEARLKREFDRRRQHENQKAYIEASKLRSELRVANHRKGFYALNKVGGFPLLSMEYVRKAILKKKPEVVQLKELFRETYVARAWVNKCEEYWNATFSKAVIRAGKSSWASDFTQWDVPCTLTWAAIELSLKGLSGFELLEIREFWNDYELVDKRSPFLNGYRLPTLRGL